MSTHSSHCVIVVHVAFGSSVQLPLPCFDLPMTHNRVYILATYFLNHIALYKYKHIYLRPLWQESV